MADETPQTIATRLANTYGTDLSPTDRLSAVIEAAQHDTHLPPHFFVEVFDRLAPHCVTISLPLSRDEAFAVLEALGEANRAAKGIEAQRRTWIADRLLKLFDASAAEAA